MTVLPDTVEVACREDDLRRAVLLDHNLNGIEYVEVDAADHRILRVHFVKPLAPAAAADPSDPFDELGIAAHPRWITIAGGTRIVGIRVASARRLPTGELEVVTDRPGDYSPYRLTIDAEGLDPFFRSVTFSFMAACPSELDCRRDEICVAEPALEPPLNYLAKDYASFRRLLLDLLPQLDPTYLERNPSDLGIALIELFAYVGDQLSYFQDAVANEAYLETLRRRISARRHARLVDYRMHDGRNAWTYVHFRVGAACVLPAPPDTTCVVTRILATPFREDGPPGLFLDEELLEIERLEGDPALTRAVVFETTHGARLDPRCNEIHIHSWGNEECCLPAGATAAHVYALDRLDAVRPPLAPGDLLLFEEVRGPDTGTAADANQSHRQVVRIEAVAEAEDPLFGDHVGADGALQEREDGDPLPLVAVRWRFEDALRFPLCVSSRNQQGAIRDVSVCRGNLVLAEHGRTVDEKIELEGVDPGAEGFHLKLRYAPLTMHCRPARADYDEETGRLTTERRDLACDVAEAQPAIALLVSSPTGIRLWTPVPDLLDSPSDDRTFVAEIDDDGRAVLRFGNDEYGRRPDDADGIHAVYKVGNGRAGNVGADSLAHVLLPAAAVDCRAALEAVRNPLAARRGVDPETIEEVRHAAPQAFRARQLRAVVPDDYAAAARELPALAGAVTNFRWTGSWYTVFVGVDPRDRRDLVDLPNGRTALAAGLESRVRAFLGTRRLAGYDIELRAPEFVPLELEVVVCVDPRHYRGHVEQAVREALSAQRLPDGRLGFFHPDNWGFGQTVYLSALYAAVEAVAGVESAVVRVFRRYGQLARGELDTGALPIGAWQIARLDADPSFVEHGVLRVITLGGKG